MAAGDGFQLRAFNIQDTVNRFPLISAVPGVRGQEPSASSILNKPLITNLIDFNTSQTLKPNRVIEIP